MPEVSLKKGEPVDRALKRLKNKLDSEGIMEEVRRLRSYETPTEKHKRKARATAKRGRIRFRFINPDSKHNRKKPVEGEEPTATGSVTVESSPAPAAPAAPAEQA